MLESTDPLCPVCRILDAVNGQEATVAVLLLRAASRVRCRCAGRRHACTMPHPHTQEGCLGYGAQGAQAEKGRGVQK